MINEQSLFITWEYMFERDFLMGLIAEMKWIEETYKNDFIDS